MTKNMASEKLTLDKRPSLFYPTASDKEKTFNDVDT
jgi:hypothetical protein